MSLRLGTTVIAGTPANDGLSITKNTNNELQTVGVINQSNTSSAVKVWTGTKAEYDLLTPDSNTVYNITDEEAGVSVKSFDLLDFKWADHLLNDENWLRADTFSWQDGTVYTDAYMHIYNDYQNGVNKTETIGSYTISYREASDGHKITTDESTVLNIYNNTGVAWYYVLDTTNQRFKLPRENPAREELISLIQSPVVGTGTSLGLKTSEGNFPARYGVNYSNTITFGPSRYLDKNVGTITSGSPSITNAQVIGISTEAEHSGLISKLSDATSTSVYKGKQYLYFYVGQYTQSATEQTAGLNSELFNSKADLDGGNVVASAGSDFRNISKWSSNVSNCITEIPQDIKLELNNGTLTLKAGSKVYVPNGFETDGVTPKFDVKTVPNDLSWTFNQSVIMCFVAPDDTLNPIMRDYCFSGSTAPTSFQGGQYAIWYDTTNNFVKFTNNAGSTWSTGTSFPFDVVGSDDSYTIFNGFGYIGSTVFALPGVKGLIPDGRNEDGTLNNIEVTTSSVQTITLNGDGYRSILLKDDAIDVTYYTVYDNNNNLLLNNSGGKLSFCDCGNLLLSSNKITSIFPKTAFHTLDWNDKGSIAGFVMPCGKRIQVTTGSSGASYISPTNGWWFAEGTTSAANNQLTLTGNGLVLSTSAPNGWGSRVILPVRKGDTILFHYNSVSPALYFVYAEGEV